MNVINVLWCRIQQSLSTFTILLLKASSETELFRHLSEYLFRVRNFEKKKSMRVIIWFKMFKIGFRFQKRGEKLEKVFCFWDNCIWIVIVKFSLLKTGYFSSVGNVLTTSHKILQVNKRDFFQLNFLGSDRWIW